MPVDTPRGFYDVQCRFKLIVALHFSLLFSVECSLVACYRVVCIVSFYLRNF